MKNWMTVGVAALAMAAGAEDLTWVGASNDWRNAESYQDGAGNPKLPTRDDVIVLPKGTQAFVDDSTVDFFSGVKAVWMSQEDTVFTVSIQNDADFGCSIGDLKSDGNQTNNLFVKDGPGTLTFTDAGLDYVKGAYAHNTGFHVKQGALDLGPSAGKTINHTYKQLIVDTGATFYCLTNGSMYFKGLSGGGTVVGRRPDNNCQPKFFIKNAPNEKLVPPTVFSGKLTGSFYTINFYGNTWLTGTESDATGTFQTYGRKDDREFVELGFMTVGAPYVPSSLCAVWSIVNADSSVYLRYLGAGGENVSRSMEIYNTVDFATTIDGGVGGLTWSGTISPRQLMYYQQRLCLTGTNATPCVFSGDLTTITSDNGKSCSFYLSKSGPGTWRLTNDATHQSGVVDAKEGTLEFDTVRCGGVPCTLGNATDLYEEKSGLLSVLAPVPYACVVGGTDSEAVFSYTGTRPPSVYDRPLAVSGLARLKAPNCTGLWWSGVRGKGAGEKRLTVECAAGQVNRLGDVSDSKTTGGEGTLSIVKDGPGDLVLSGDLTFGGDLVAKGGGTLTVQDVKDKPYGYYRLNIKETVASSTLPEYDAYLSAKTSRRTTCKIVMSEFGLYGSDGKRIAKRDMNATNDCVAALEKGKSALENAELYSIAANSGVGDLFDNSTGSGYNFNVNWSASGKRPVIDRQETWARAICRLSDADPTVASFDLMFMGGTDTDNMASNPTAFSIDASSDGFNWEELYSTNNIVFLPPTYYFWLTSMTSAYTNEPWAGNYNMTPENAPHGRIPLPRSVMLGGQNLLGNVRSVGAAKGATLKYEGAAAKEVAGLRFDAKDGIGLIRNFTLAASGTVYVDGVGDERMLKIPGDLSGIGNLENAADWTLFVNGAASTRYTCTVTETGVTIAKKGLMLIVR